MKIFDTHAHYDDEAFDKDRDELLTSLFNGDIGAVVNVGASLEGCIESVRLAEKYDNIYAAIGVHPDDYERLERGETPWSSAINDNSYIAGSFMDWLKKEGYQVAIVSNKADFAVKKLNQIYFGSLIRVAIGEREGIRKKPAPDTVFQALKELAADAAHAVYNGESDVDIQTARNSGMDGIAVNWGFRSREFLLEHGAVPERIAANINEVKALLQE